MQPTKWFYRTPDGTLHGARSCPRARATAPTNIRVKLTYEQYLHASARCRCGPWIVHCRNHHRFEPALAHLHVTSQAALQAECPTCAARVPLHLTRPDALLLTTAAVQGGN